MANGAKRLPSEMWRSNRTLTLPTVSSSTMSLLADVDNASPYSSCWKASRISACSSETVSAMSCWSSPVHQHHVPVRPQSADLDMPTWEKRLSQEFFFCPSNSHHSCKLGTPVVMAKPCARLCFREGEITVRRGFGSAGVEVGACVTDAISGIANGISKSS